MKNIFILMAGMSFLFWGSCKRPGSNLPNYAVDADLAAAFSYKPGTYWIYKDSLTGQIDSFYVTQLTTNNFKDPSGTYTYDLIGVYFAERGITSLTSTDTSSWRIYLQQNQFSLDHYWKYEYVDYDAVEYPFINNSSKGVYNERVIINNSITINSKIYANTTTINYYSNNINDSYFIYPNIGMLKISINHSYDSFRKIWELQKSNVIK